MAVLASHKELARTIQRLKKSRKKIVTTNGCFDILHVGHVRYLRKARELGDSLVVGVNSDESVRRLKGKGRPVNGQSDRAEVLDALSFVHHVFVFEEDNPIAFLETVKPKIHAKGGDYSMADIVERETVESHNGQVVLIDMIPGKSTTATLSKIRKTRVKTAVNKG